MALQVTGKNLDIGEALRSYVVERIESTLDKYVGEGPSGHVRIEKERGAFRTDCSIHLRSGLSLQARGEAPDAYASADLALERLDTEVKRTTNAGPTWRLSNEFSNTTCTASISIREPCRSPLPRCG